MGLVGYVKEVRGELKHVSWPTRHQVGLFTVAVIIVSILTSLYLGVFDFLFQEGLQVILPEGTPTASTSNAIEFTPTNIATSSAEATNQ